jgi:hypothetical protein
VAVAADSYAPFATGAGADTGEETWRSFMKYALGGDGVIVGAGLDVEPFADSTGMQVKLRTGEVWIQGHWGKVSTTKVLPITNNSSGSTRLDRVVARCDFDADRIEFDVLPGLPGTGVPLAPTQNTSRWEIPLGTVTVPTGSVTIAATRMLDERPPVGGPLRYKTTLTTAHGTVVLGTGGEAFTYWERRGPKAIRVGGTIKFGGAGLDASYDAISIALPAGIKTVTQYEQVGWAKLWTPSTSTSWWGQVFVPSDSSTIQPWFAFANDIGDMQPWQAANAAGVTGTGIPEIAGQYSVQQNGNITFGADINIQ